MMTPVREFLYFLIILIVFGFFLYVREDNTKKPAPISDIYVPEDRVVDIPQQIEKNEQLPIVEVVPEPEKESPVALLNPTPLVFAADDTIRFQYLFDKLRNIGQEKLPVRIVYFGDSQIENDRVTSTLRKQLQEKYGGKGPGFIPLDQYYNTSHQLMIETSKNWEIKTFQDKDFINQSLLFKNALLTDSSQQAWFRIKRINRQKAKPDYQLMKLYYSAKDSCQVTLREGRETIYSGYLLANTEVATLDFQFNRTPNNIRFDFQTRDTINISGLSLETSTGVLVDNIALRGLSYPTFEWSDQEMIKQMLDQVNVGLFVLHFGVNLVPYPSADYHYFRKHFKRQIAFLKQIRPDVPILIIGVSDMAERQNNQIQSYQNIPAIKMIQREIAMESHAAFWDLQNFMGGNGGMLNWVNAKPALGRKDYTHFSKQGADAIGNELAKLILNEIKTDSISVP